MKKNSLRDKAIFHLIKDDKKIKKDWERIFTSSVEEQVKEKVYFDYFRWHLFSYGILKAKEGDEARKCFNQSIKEKRYESYSNPEKNKLFVFYEDDYDTYEIEITEYLEASWFDQECDIYIFDIENKWTYVNTHEDEIGPFFYWV